MTTHNWFHPKILHRLGFKKSLKSDMVLNCKNNHAKNKDLNATRPVACERYCRGLLYKIGFKPIGSLDLKTWIY
jgi:hypothetical protein